MAELSLCTTWHMMGVARDGHPMRCWLFAHDYTLASLVCVFETVGGAVKHCPPEGKRTGERKRPTFHPQRPRTICVQPGK